MMTMKTELSLADELHLMSDKSLGRLIEMGGMTEDQYAAIHCEIDARSALRQEVQAFYAMRDSYEV